MPILIEEKASRVSHQLDIQSFDACLKVKAKLVASVNASEYVVKQLYVHVPLCFFHCSFCVYKGDLLHTKRQIEEFVAYFETESEVLSPLVHDVSFQSVFVGGGTVTVLDPQQLQKLLTIIKAKFDCPPPSGEFTIELAPHGLTNSKLDVLVEHGVNRVTMGVQSLDESLLRTMTRPAIPKEKLKGIIREVLTGPFADVNFDLMVGVPGRTYENLRRDFFQLAEWGCKSIMIYIDMLAYRDSARLAQVSELKMMVARLAEEVAASFTVNSGAGINEYNHFVANNRYSNNSPVFTSRYSTEQSSDDIFCLGVGRQAKSWSRDMIFSWN